MTASRRVTLRFLSAIAAAMSFALPAAAQNSDAPVDVTAAPPTSADTVGPSQLQNFNLKGTVTRSSDRSAPVATPPAVAPSERGKATTVADPGGEIITAPGAARPARVATADPRQVPTDTGSSSLPEIPTPSLPLAVTTGPAEPAVESADASSTAASLGNSESSLSWPWIAALLALIGGGGFIAWSKRGRTRRYSDEGRMAFAGLVPDVDASPVELPPARPRADPVPPRTQPTPRPDPVPSVRKPQSKPADDGMVKSTALKPELNFQFVPDRAVVTEQEVMLQFDVVLTNSGAAPARDVLVEAKLVPAHAGQDEEIAAFFQQPQATGDRMAGIPPLGKVSLKSAVRLPLDQLHSFEVDGRKLFVPLVAFNILFRGSGGEGQASASYLVGRGTDGDEKLAPFRLDLGPRIFRGLSARPHSMGLAR